MNTIDIILGIFIFFTFLIGLKKGFIASIINLIALIISLILISQLGPVIKIFLIKVFSLREIIAIILSYVIIFTLIIIIARITILILQKVITFLNLSFINRFLGAIFGLINGVMILIILLLICDISPFREDVKNLTRDSKIVKYLRIFTDEIETNIKPIKKEEKAKRLEDIINKAKEKI